MRHRYSVYTNKSNCDILYPKVAEITGGNMSKASNAVGPVSDPPMKPDEAQNIRLWVALQQASNFMADVREKDVSRYDVTNMESAILNAIHEIGVETTPAAVTRRISILKPHSVSETLTALETRGLVTKSKDLPKKNLVRVQLTEKGQATLHETAKRESIHRMFAALTREEKNQLEPIHDKLLKEALKERLRSPLLYQKEASASIAQIYEKVTTGDI
jgi:DNA-binding MarR family transcriptional regulator